MAVFDSPHFDLHERVVFVSDAASGLRAIIAIHSTQLGPAIGGCRAWSYPDPRAALDDVLRLSRGMTYKAACAGVPFGGGKAVVLLDERRHKHAGSLKALGRAIQELGGRYITGEDVGTTSDDMATLREATPHVLGAPADVGGSGDPSPSTAAGCLIGIRTAVRHRLGRASLEGVRVAVQGLGNVGYSLCEQLAAEGARLWVSDVRAERVERAAYAFDATPVGIGEIARADVDVFAPCALGGVLDAATVAGMRAAIVAGAANNQLAAPGQAEELARRDVLYAPDYVINAGGMIQLALEHGRRLAELPIRLQGIGETLDTVFAIAQRERCSTAQAADGLARQRLARGVNA